MKISMRLAAMVTVFASTSFGQGIAGDWQGTLKVGTGLRLVVKISPAAEDKWTASMFSIDQSPDWGGGDPDGFR